MNGVESGCLAKIIQYFSDEPLVSAVYLFGSMAKGTAGRDSDIDLGILFGEGLAKEERFDLRLKIAGDLEEICGRLIDVVDLEEATLFFQYQVRKTGCLIVEKDHKHRVEFVVRSRREYFDLHYILERRNNALIAKF
ncbi:MAG TPA: nucleotidyltransferase domain-containing protein [Negativicutes bacterium]